MDFDGHQSAATALSTKEKRPEKIMAPPMSKEDNMKHHSYQTSNVYTIVKRDGSIVPFQRERISTALESAFRDTKALLFLLLCLLIFNKRFEQLLP